MRTINLYSSVAASGEVLRAVHHLRTVDGDPVRVVVRPLGELPQPQPGAQRRRYFLEDEEPAAPPAPEGGLPAANHLMLIAAP